MTKSREKHARPVADGRAFWWTGRLWAESSHLPVVRVPTAGRGGCAHRMEHNDVRAVNAVMTTQARDRGMFPPRVSAFHVGSTLDVGRQQARATEGVSSSRAIDVFVSYDPVHGSHDDFYRGNYDDFIMVVDHQGRWLLDERGGEG